MTHSAEPANGMTHKRSATLVISLLAGIAMRGTAAARPDDAAVTCEHCRLEAFGDADSAKTRLGFDEANGRDLANYPPHRLADFQHMRLELMIADMNQTRLDGKQTLTIEPIAEPLTDIDLDARRMDIRSVTAPGHTCRFTLENEKLRLEFDPPLPVGKAIDITTTYTITNPADGLYWFPESAAWPGRPAQLHTQGQPQTISSLFPCHDFPNERLTTELIVTVPAGYEVSSNGHLVAHTNHILTRDTAEGGTKLVPYEKFHWLQDKPHVNYLVSLVVGKFDIVDVGSNKLPMPVYAPVGRGGDIRGTYGKTPEMVAHFSKLLDEPYPWDRYAQLVVWNFAAGGMENTSATTMYDTAIIDKASLDDTDLEGLISHELAHQWFGDLMTCNSWEHVWLNEGFATYLSALWFEHEDGPDGYQAYILGNMDGVRANDKADAPYQPGMASKYYKHPFEPFRRPGSPYSKGSSILHMLRQKLGDAAFFKGVALYIDRRKLETVETSDLRRALEDVSGESLEQFFEQWCIQPGVPNLDIKISWDTGASSLNIDVEQKQNINPYNPAFEFDLPVWVDVAPEPGKASSGSRAGRWLTLPVTKRSQSWSFPLPAEPKICAVDPNMAVLAQLNIEQPADRWLAQLESGSTLAAKVQAARALGKIAAPEASQALRDVANNRKAYKTIRVEAVKALEATGDQEALTSLITSAVDIYEVRLAVCESLARLAAREDSETSFRTTVADTLVKRATQDPSTKVRAASVLGLARLKANDAWAITQSALKTDSQDDRLRQAALDALVELDRAEALPLAVSYTRPGVLSRTRPEAIKSVVKLAKHDPNAAYAAIAPLLADKEGRTRDTAGQGLADLKDPRGVAELQNFIATCDDLRLKSRAEGWLETLEKNLQPAPEPKAEPVPAS